MHRLDRFMFTCFMTATLTMDDSFSLFISVLKHKLLHVPSKSMFRAFLKKKLQSGINIYLEYN